MADVLFGTPPPSWRALDPAVYTRLGAHALAAVPSSVVASPRWLAVMHTGQGFVCEGPSPATTTDPRAAMPVRLYRVATGVVVHVPCGQFDAPSRGEYTFLGAGMAYVASTFASAPVWPAAALS
jgi:hypothetical protein